MGDSGEYDFGMGDGSELSSRCDQIRNMNEDLPFEMKDETIIIHRRISLP